MIPENVIELAEKGGYLIPEFPKDLDGAIEYSNEGAEGAMTLMHYKILFDPAFWQALGKSLGWKEEKEMGCLWRPGEVEGVVVGLVDRGTPTYYAHIFFDYILDNGDTEAFWQDLLNA